MKKNSPADINKLSSKTTESAAIDQSEAEEVARKSINCTPGSPYSLREITIIDNMESFLKANGATAVDPKVIKTVAETWTKRFNTSPGTLQDVTMDQSYGVGYRSPCVSLQQFQGATSPPPTQGRSVREFEEQMATLRKENFNLKLRLYFIEESIPGYQQALQSSGGHETIMKQLVDCKVEMEMLRKEIQDKQEILKDAAHAMNQMEKIQKDTETKCQAIIDELKQKIQYLEMERDMDKSHHGEFMNDLLGRSDISENLNALQKIRELEGIVKQSDDKIKEYESHIGKIDKIVVKRDETIREYEEKVKELVFQNAELVEAVEFREKELVNAERNIRCLHLSNADLKEDNQNLTDALTDTQDNFRKEMSNMKVCERQMREQQDVLTKMQSTISIKTANTARLLDRIQDYEKMVTKMNFERNLDKRENRFFRAIISKLQRNKNEYYTIEKKEIYHQIGSAAHTDFDDKQPLVDQNKHNYVDANYHCEMKRLSDFHGEYKLKQKLCVNFSNSAKFTNTSSASDICNHVGHCVNCVKDAAEGSGELVENYLRKCCDFECEIEPEFPIRYTISDASLFAADGGDCVSKTNSCSSLQANMSSSSLFGDSKEMQNDVYLKTRRLRQELQEHKTELADKICMLQDAEEKLNSRTQIHEQACRTIQKLMLNITNQKLEIIRLKKNSGGSESNANSSGPNKENMHSSSNVNDSTGLCRSMSDSEALNELSLTQKQKLERTIEQQELTIKNLKAEVKKKTANLQNLVNKELWEKNREIERLTKLINRDSANGTSTVSPTALNTSTNNDGCCNELQQSFTDADYSKAVDRNKLLQRKVEVLIKRLANVHSHDALITRLRKEAHEAQAEAYSAEKWRRECAEVCGMLSTRLEELAGFLNSLLKHKDILGFLAVDRRRAMRNAIDRSLDLSKSLNQTLSISGISMTEHSFGHLSCNLSTLDVDVDNTFNSHEDTQEQFDSLKAENRALKKELDKRRSVELKKDRRSLPQGVPSILVAAADNQSESDAWSEPDRIVSLARIGLEDRSASLTTKDTKSQSHQQLQNSGAAAATTDSESDELNDSRTSKTRTQDRVTHLEQLLAQRDDRILHIQCQLVEADNRLKKENLRVIDLNHEINDLRQRNEELNADIMAIGLVEQHDDSTLQRQIDEKTRSLEKIQEERERIAMEARLAEMQIGELKSDIEDLKLKQEVDLTLAAEKEKRKLEELQRDMKAQMQQRIVELEYKHEDALARDWVVRAVYDESHKQLATLQQQYVEAQRTIEYLQENEQELKQTLVESELEVRSLKKQLDESTLQASKAVLERTKVCNDKLQLEKRVQQLTQQIAVEEEERNDLRRNVLHLKNTQAVLQGKITALQEQLATNRFNGSDVSQSGYTSEEIPNVMPSSSADATTALNLSQQQQRRTVDAIKHVNSPSPDLGIESDAGRVSSVELSQAQCTLYKTVELSATNTPSNSSTFAADTDMGHTSTRNIKEEENSDSPMEQKANVKEEKLDYQGNVPITASATINTSPATESATTAAATATAPALPIKHDCAKVEAENAELRRKLIRTKQAFEDTYKTLHMANQKKAQVEKNIKNQILKTHSLLKNVRSNLEN